jgi:hypothetical protein
VPGETQWARQAPCKSLKGVFGYFFSLEKVTKEKNHFMKCRWRRMTIIWGRGKENDF